MILTRQEKDRKRERARKRVYKHLDETYKFVLWDNYIHMPMRMRMISAPKITSPKTLSHINMILVTLRVTTNTVLW